MKLQYKLDFTEARRYWEIFWNKDVIDRPCVIISSPKEGISQSPAPPYMAGSDGNYENALNMFEKWASTTYFGAEAIPYFNISFGPDQLAGFLGAEIETAPDGRTSWSKPFVKDWKNILELKIDEENPLYKRTIDFYRYAAKFSKGKFLLGVLDFHSNMDWLAAIRGSEKLCTDLIDYPEEIGKRMKEARKLFPVIYETMYKAGNMEKRGTIGWIPLYCENKFAVIQCDFICLMSPAISRRFIIPALEEEASYLDHCIYHLDGPGALVHLDDILAIPRIDAIQWVPGAGNLPHIKWIALFKKILNKDKSVIIYPQSADEVEVLHKELGAKGIVYQLTLSSEKEGEELIRWLRLHT